MSDQKQRKPLGWLKQYAVVLFAPTVILGAASYILKQKFDSSYERKQEQYQLNKDSYISLYEEGQPKIVALRTSRDKLFNLLKSNYGISSFEMKEYLIELKKVINLHDEYVSKLEFQGNQDQLTSAQEIQFWSHNIYSKFNSQSLSAERVEESIRYMIINSYNVSEENSESYIKFHLEKIHRELDELIQEENRLYYEFQSLSTPIFDALYNIFIHNFRVSNGLEVTAQKNKSKKILSEFNYLRERAKYKNSPIPYFVAEQRSIFSNDFTADSDEIIETKNSFLKMQLLGKFMEQVSENDPYLKQKKEENLKKMNE